MNIDVSNQNQRVNEEGPIKQIINLDPNTKIKKDREQIKQLLPIILLPQTNEEQLKIQILSKQIKRRMLQTNLSDRRTLGGILGATILGVVGFASGLNVIGAIVGGVLGALLGTYVGRRIKQNAMRKKKLLNIDLHIVRFAALVEHLLEFDIKQNPFEEIRQIIDDNIWNEVCQFLIIYSFFLFFRRLIRLLFSESKLLILLSAKLRKQERKQVFRIQRELLKLLQNQEQLIIIKEIQWVIKEWIKLKQEGGNNWQEYELEVAKIIFSFLRPLAKLLVANKKFLNEEQKTLERKVQQLLLQVSIIELREKYPQMSSQQEEVEEEFLDTIYKEVELLQLKAIMEDQTVIEILKEEEMKEKQLQMQQQQPHQDSSLLMQLDQSKAENKEEINKNNNNNNAMNQSVSAPKEELQNSSSFVVWNLERDNKFQSPSKQLNNNITLTKQKSRLIDLIQMASQKKEQEHIESSHKKPNQFQDEEQQVNPFILNHPFLFFHEQATAAAAKQIEEAKYSNSYQEQNLKVACDKQTKQELEELKFVRTEEAECKPMFKKDGYIHQKQLANIQDADEELAAQTFSLNDKKVLQSIIFSSKVNMSKQDNKPNKQKVDYFTPNSKKQSSLQKQSPQKKKFENNDDLSNYQTYIEEVRGNINSQKNIIQIIPPKKLMQPIYFNNYQDNSKNCPEFFKDQSDYQKVQDIHQNEALQIKEAIEELKQDNKSLNLQHSQSKFNEKSITNNQAPLSFQRNKHPDLFLKMKSSDSILQNNSCLINEMQNNKENNKEQGDVINASLSFSANKLNISRSSNKKDQLHKNLSDKSQISNQNYSQPNANNQLNLSNPNLNEVTINCFILDEEAPMTPKKQKQSNQKNQSYLDDKEIKVDGHFGSNIYSKDDQIQLDNVVVDMTRLSENKKQSTQVVVDLEIESKMSKLRELDLENPDKFWERVIEKDKIKIYKKQIPNNPSVMVRAEAIVEDCSLEEVFDQIYYEQLRKKWDKVTLGFSVIDKFEGMKDVIYFYIDPGFGVTKRDFLQKRAVRRDFPEPGVTTILFFSTTHPLMPEKKGWIRAISHIAAYILRPIQGNKNATRLSIITQSDVKGQIPKYIVNFLAARAPAKWIESMKKGVQTHRKLEIKK